MSLSHFERKQRAAVMKDSRPQSHKVAAASRRPVPFDPDSKLDKEIAALEKQKHEAKLAKMSPADRQLAMLKELRDREPVEPGKPHPRAAKIEAILDRICLAPEGTREYSAYELGVLTLAQHQTGMDPTEADRLWNELLAQEQAYADSVETSINERRSALEAELAALNTNRATLPTTANQYKTLLAAAVGTQAIPFPPGSEGYADEIRAAEGSEELQAAVVSKYATQVQQYEASQQ